MHAQSPRLPTSVRHAADPSAAGGLARWWPLVLLGAAQFMLIIDVTVVNVALPSIGRELDLDRAAMTWVAIAYTLFFGGLLLVGGRLADSFGRRRIFLSGLVLFTVASVASGLASSGTFLIVARALQGVGAALMSPAALSMVTTMYQGRDRTRALGVWAALGGAGAAFGVVLGGLLAAGPGWQWVFLVNVPVGVAIAIGSARIIPALVPVRAGGGIDLPGVLLAVPAVALLLYSLVGAGDSGWTSIATMGPIGLAAVLLVAFVWRERTAREPLVRLEVLRDRFLSGGLTLIVGVSALLAGTFFLISLYLQRVAGLSPLDAGLLFLPVAIALLVGAQAGSGLAAHAGGRPTIVIGLIVVTAGLSLLARMPEAVNVLVDVIPGFVMAGLGIGAVLVAAMTMAFTRIADSDSGLASSLVNTSHEVGFAVGVSVLSTLASASIAGQGVGGFQFAFGVAAAMALALAAVSMVMLPRERSTVAVRAFAH